MLKKIFILSVSLLFILGLFSFVQADPRFGDGIRWTRPPQDNIRESRDSSQPREPRLSREPRGDREAHASRGLIDFICERLAARGIFLPFCDEEPSPPPSPVAVCGNGVLEEEAGEVCDVTDGLIPGYTCSQTCELERIVTIANHVVINEIYADVDAGHGNEGDNEWVELYNPTASDIDLTGWLLGEDTLPASTIPAHGYAFITPGAVETTSLNFWTLPPDTAVILLDDSRVDNGLANGNDALRLFNPAAEEVDGVSYGGILTILNPAAPVAGAGESIEREPDGNDNNAGSDFVIRKTPTPGE